MAWKVGLTHKLLTIVLMVQMLLASAATKGTLVTLNTRRNLHSKSFDDERRLLQAVLGEPLLPRDTVTACLGIGPVCPEGEFVECAVGGIVGCMCALIRECEPDVSNCYLKVGKVSSYCGF